MGGEEEDIEKERKKKQTHNSISTPQPSLPELCFLGSSSSIGPKL